MHEELIALNDSIQRLQHEARWIVTSVGILPKVALENRY
jgi:hypothetical protein